MTADLILQVILATIVGFLAAVGIALVVLWAIVGWSRR